MNEAIRTEQLRKTFGRVTALAGLDLHVRRGEVHGFLGPNGAGKSTTLRALLGLLRLDSGTATVLGQNPWADAATLHRRLAYVPGDVVLWPSLTGGEVIDVMGKLGAGIDPVRRTHLIDRFDLDPTKKTRAYSKGNRQKVALIAALATNAELLLLDEPTSGLDPLMEKAFRDEIDQVRRQGKTVLLSSHILSEIEATCDRLSIVRSGRIVETGSLDELRQLTRSTIRAQLRTPPTEVAAAAWPGVADLRLDGDSLHCSVAADQLPDVLQRLTACGVRTLVCQPPSLEDLFLQRYSQGAATASLSDSASS